MKMFKHSSGFIVSFGFDMDKRVPDKRIICWSDPQTCEWDMKTDNLAGWVRLPYDIETEFVFEVDGRIVAYQPGRCIEMIQIGAPIVWAIRHLSADNKTYSIAA